MPTPRWRQGWRIRAALATAVATSLVLSVWGVHDLANRSHSTDLPTKSEASTPAQQSRADSLQQGGTPASGHGAPTPGSTTGVVGSGTKRAYASHTSPALDWLSPRSSAIGSALTPLPLDPPQSTGAPRSDGTSRDNDQGNPDNPQSDGQPGPGAPGLPTITPPSRQDAPDPPKVDTRKARKALAKASAAVTAVPRTVESMDADAYVRKYSTEMGSQIRRVERRITRTLPGTNPPGTSPPKDNGNRRDNQKQTTQRQQPRDVRGIDVSGWQKNVNWKYWWKKGKRFAYVKATEGTGYTNPYYPQQYNGSRRVGMTRGSYHFALPNRSSGAAQAVYFVTNGGGWSRDGRTLPGAVDLEWNPYGPACYGKSKAGMRAWIKSFHDTYRTRTGRWPVIYTSTSWWSHCVGGGHRFGKTVPLWIARYSSNVGALPPGWNRYTFWQYSSDPIDQNAFNGSHARLRALANGR